MQQLFQAVALAGAMLVGVGHLGAETLDTAAAPEIVIAVDDLADKIRGGFLGQIIGNLNGLPHEFKYINEPGQIEEFVPSLPQGARTDDDTDLEWVFVREIARNGHTMVPPARIVELWTKHVNRGIWCANRYARDLMDLGFEPPQTGHDVLNPWSDFNISGQFACETYGLIAPAMPQTAARIALNYAHITVDGEPTQATQLISAMIATAFIEEDLNRLLDAGLMAVDPESHVAEIVGEVRQFHEKHPEDWHAMRQHIKELWQVRNGNFRDQNGYELNTACTVAALLYGEGDLVETLRLAFNLGWDCDNNAATAATILGVLKGRRWIDAKGWDIKDVYANTTRDNMPMDEKISGFENSIIECARLAILEQGGGPTTLNGGPALRIRSEKPANVERLPESGNDQTDFHAQLTEEMERDLTGQPVDQARAAYIAICLSQSARLATERLEQWNQAVAELRQFSSVIRNIFEAPGDTASGQRIQQNARAVGLIPPPK